MSIKCLRLLNCNFLRGFVMKNIIVMLVILLSGGNANEMNVSQIFLDVNETLKVSDKNLFSTALHEKNLKYCSRINNEDKKIECFGIVKRNSGYCDMIGSKDLKNKCLSVALDDKSLCDAIEDKATQTECINLSQ